MNALCICKYAAIRVPTHQTYVSHIAYSPRMSKRPFRTLFSPWRHPHKRKPLNHQSNAYLEEQNQRLTNKSQHQNQTQHEQNIHNHQNHSEREKLRVTPYVIHNNRSMAHELFPRITRSPQLRTDTEEAEFILGRSPLVARKISDHLVRCTVFDPHGNVSVVSGEYKRSELLSKHGLLPRDLRKLDIGVSSLVPSILVRDKSILVNLLHIRALIKANQVLIFDAFGSTDSKTQSLFYYDLEHKLRHGSKTMGGLPYELRALEAIFISVVSSLDAEMQVLKRVITTTLEELEIDINREKLRLLLVQSKKLSSFHQKATLIRDAIDDLLDQDEDLAGLYLTAKLDGQPRDEEDDHSEAEMLLESYYKHCNEIVQTTDNLISNIRSTEEIINIILDSNRNSLMLLDLKFQIGTLGLSGGAFISALYGMNLQNFIEESDWGFASVSGVVGITAAVIIIISLKNLRKVQRITMMSESRQPSVSKGFMSWLRKGQ